MFGLQLHPMRIVIAAAIFAVAYFLFPTVFSDPLPAVGFLLFAFFASWPIFKWYKKTFLRPIIMFDMHGVFITGDQSLDNFTKMPGMRELVEAMRPNYCLVAFTNMSPELFGLWNSKFHFDRHFDYVFVSGFIRLKKPDPEAFRTVARKLGVRPSDIVFFDDVEANVKGAKEAGLRAHHFKSPEQAAKVLHEMGVKI